MKKEKEKGIDVKERKWTKRRRKKRKGKENNKKNNKVDPGLIPRYFPRQSSAVWLQNTSAHSVPTVKRWNVYIEVHTPQFVVS